MSSSRIPKSTRSAANEKTFHIGKKTKMGASGAVVGAIVAGPIGALLGGVLGTAFGAAAGKEEPAKKSALSPKKTSQPASRASALRPRKQKARVSHVKRSAELRKKTHRRKRGDSPGGHG